MAKRVRKTAVKKESENRTSKPIPIAKRTDWGKMKLEVMALILCLRQRPNAGVNCFDGCRESPTSFGILSAYCHGDINVEQFTLMMQNIYQPISVESRTDWEELEEEVRDRIVQLRQRPNKSAPRNNKPATVINAYVAGDIEAKQTITLLEEWAGLPIEEQRNLPRLRQQVLAVMARIHRISENCYDKCYLSADDIVADLFKGMLTREQAVTKLNKLIHIEG